jgi:hypothetical protein
MEYSQVVRQSFLVRSFKGSNSFIPKFYLFLFLIIVLLFLELIECE